MSTVSKKICLIGDFSVGKTSLIRRFIEDIFSEKYLTTIGTKIYRKVVNLNSSSKEIDLIIWDIEGHTKFKSIVPNYIKGATGAIIVGDLSRQETLDHLPAHIELFFQTNPKGVAIVALNKSDIIEEHKLTKLLELNNFASNSQIINTIVTSAKNNTNVDLAFTELAEKMANS